MTITLEGEGVTVLTSPVADQAALHSLLKQERDLGLSLLSANTVKLEP
jgi:predicted regulator of Ras-like GTPase activity (Roadblock/LC7/MglB family)